MIQVHGKTILSMEFKSIIKAHGLNPWQFIYPKLSSRWQYLKPNSHWQHQAQFSLAMSKPNSRWQYLKPSSHWQYQSPILIGNIKVQFSLAIFKAQFSLTTSKPNSHWQY